MADTVGQVAQGDCSPRAPTDPYMPALEHTAPHIIASQCFCKPSERYPQDSNERFQFIRISSNPKLNLTQLLSLHLSTPRRVWRGPRDEGKEADQTEGGACFRFPSNKERLTPCCLSWIERGLQESAKTSRPHFCCYRFSVAIG
jgi:hypothetical protein